MLAWCSGETGNSLLVVLKILTLYRETVAQLALVVLQFSKADYADCYCNTSGMSALSDSRAPSGGVSAPSEV